MTLFLDAQASLVPTFWSIRLFAEMEVDNMLDKVADMEVKWQIFTTIIMRGNSSCKVRPRGLIAKSSCTIPKLSQNYWQSCIHVQRKKCVSYEDMIWCNQVRRLIWRVDAVNVRQQWEHSRRQPRLGGNNMTIAIWRQQDQEWQYKNINKTIHSTKPVK